MSKLKTFRGRLDNLEQDRIYLAGGNDSTGFKINKFEIMGQSPFFAESEAVMKIYTVSQAGSIDSQVDMGDETLLGVSISTNDSANPVNSGYRSVIFDQTIVNQDIFVTYKTNQGSEKCNYYIELEEVKINDSEAAVINYKAALQHT
tara:strand:- start:245 stop:685 length:441 start_codon:yes stop_codon:yes gene_type:complete